MNPLLQALLSSWEFRPLVVALLLLAGLLYGRGWRRLRRRNSKLATHGRLVCYYSGLFALSVSLLSPIDQLGGQLFFMHMIQHLLSIMVAAPLLWLGNPFPIGMWGVPVSVRPAAASLFVAQSPLRRLFVAVSSPALAWILFVVVYVGWHEPALYNLALRREWVHDVQHITFFGVGLLYWWQVIDAGPYFQKRMIGWARGAFLIATIPPNMLTGIFISFADQPIYAYYESIPRIWGFTVMQDQQLGGAIMWIPGSMMFLVAGLIVMALMFKDAAPVRDRAERKSVPHAEPHAS
jgi:cytochrome c oxidase assembly factor CtaG